MDKALAMVAVRWISWTMVATGVAVIGLVWGIIDFSVTSRLDEHHDRLKAIEEGQDTLLASLSRIEGFMEAKWGDLDAKQLMQRTETPAIDPTNFYAGWTDKTAVAPLDPNGAQVWADWFSATEMTRQCAEGGVLHGNPLCSSLAVEPDL